MGTREHELIVDDARVEVVQNVLAVVMIGCTRAHAWAVAIVEALDRHDYHTRLERPRGNMGFDDETEPDTGRR